MAQRPRAESAGRHHETAVSAGAPARGPPVAVARDPRTASDPPQPARTPTRGKAVSLIGLTQYDGKGIDAKPREVDPETKEPLEGTTKLRATTSTRLPPLAELPVNTRVTIDHEVDGWYHVVAPGGLTGFIWGELLLTYAGDDNYTGGLPDPEAIVHRIEPGETAFDICNRQYEVGPDAGYENLRFYANGLVAVNKKAGRFGIYEPTAAEKKKIQKEAIRKYGRVVYDGAATKAHAQIILPSKQFADTLKVSSGSWIRDVGRKIAGWAEKAVAFLAFPAGLVVGALECLWDTVSGIVKMVWSLIKGVFTGSLLSDLKAVVDAIVKLLKEPATRQAALTALADFLESKWDNANTIKRWFGRGWIIGYLTAEVLLTLFSGGETLLAAAAGKFKALRTLVEATSAGQKALAGIHRFGEAAKTSKAAKLVKETADAVKASKPAQAATKAGKAVATSAPARVLSKAGRAAAFKARWVLGIPRRIIDRISETLLIRLDKLSPKAAAMMRSLDEISLKKLLGCSSPCRFDVKDVESKLLRKRRLERSRTLGELRRYRVQAADDTMNAAQRKELRTLIKQLEDDAITPQHATRAYQDLLARARATRTNVTTAKLQGTATEHKVTRATRKRMGAIESTRRKLQEKRARIADKRDALAERLGVDPDNITDDVIDKLRRKRATRGQADELAKLDAQYKAEGRKLVSVSEKLGVEAARDFAKSKDAKRLYEGPRGTSGTLDVVYIKEGRPVVLYVCEAKGGGSGLGTKSIGGVTYEQGTPQYLRWMLKNDEGFAAAARKKKIYHLVEKGKIEVHYHLVQAPGGSKVLVNEFDIGG